MLDNLSNGRLDLGVGRGIVPMEAAHYDVDIENGRDMFHEAMDILVMGMTDGVLNYEGKYYNYQDIQVWGEPQQKPYPPLWYATNNRIQYPGLLSTASIPAACLTRPRTSSLILTCTGKFGRKTTPTRVASTVT